MRWSVLRTPSFRKELKYQVIKVKSDSEMDSSIVAYLNKCIATYKENDRAIVFCRSKRHVTTLATLFKTHPYYAAGEDDDHLQKNKEAMIKWVSGENPIMTSTSILGCGIDYAHIRDVVHRDPAYTMLDQYQEDSRGGRDGMECRATTFIVENKKYSMPDQLYDLGTKNLYHSIYDERCCRRMAASLFLDGKSVQCINIMGAVFCDFCETISTPSFSGIESASLIPPFQVQLPPQRSLDIFDPSPPHLDLREHARPQKRKHISFQETGLLSPHLCSSSAKRVKFPDTV